MVADQLDVSRIRARMPERQVHYFASTTTTMAEAARLAASGAPAGTIVLADRQTAGRGRMGRAWYSESGGGLYLTLILRPGRTVPLLTLAVGLAVRETLAEFAGPGTVDIRWPNDVLLSGRKVAGILVTTDGDYMLAGIGLNVNHAGFPAELDGLATSLRIASGQAHDREEVLIRLMAHLEQAFSWPPAEVIQRFEKASSYARGKAVEIDDTGQRGETCGLDSEGFLQLRLTDGRVERILAGGVRPIGETP